jgi:hypothetical protein
MDKNQDFSHLRFDRRIRNMNPRLTAFIVSVIIYFVLWILLPPAAILTLLLFVTSILVWVASFGWQEALGKIIRFLQNLQI